ncbi:hypothetical protein IAR50_006130 [Cryptococcus sp. DSM 104548]
MDWWEDNPTETAEETETAPVQAVDRETPSPKAVAEPSTTPNDTLREEPSIHPIDRHAPSGPAYITTHYEPYTQPVSPYEDTVNISYPVYYPVVVHPPTHPAPYHTAHDQWMYEQQPRLMAPAPQSQAFTNTGLNVSRQRSEPAIQPAYSWYGSTAQPGYDPASLQTHLPQPSRPQPDLSGYGGQPPGPQYTYPMYGDPQAWYKFPSTLAQQAPPWRQIGMNQRVTTTQRSVPAFPRSSIDTALGHDSAPGGDRGSVNLHLSQRDHWLMFNRQYMLMSYHGSGQRGRVRPMRHSIPLVHRNQTNSGDLMAQAQNWRDLSASHYPEPTYSQAQLPTAPLPSRPPPSRRRSFMEARPIASMTNFVKQHISRSPTPQRQRPESAHGSDTLRQSGGGDRGALGAALKKRLSRSLGDKADVKPQSSRLPSDDLLRPHHTSPPSSPAQTTKRQHSTPLAPWSSQTESVQTVSTETPGVLRLQKDTLSGWEVDTSAYQGGWPTVGAKSPKPKRVDPRLPTPTKRSPSKPLSLSSTSTYGLKPPKTTTDAVGWQTVRHRTSRSATSAVDWGKGKRSLKKDLKAGNDMEARKSQEKEFGAYVATDLVTGGVQTGVGFFESLQPQGHEHDEGEDEGQRNSDDGQALRQEQSQGETLHRVNINTSSIEPLFISDTRPDSTTPTPTAASPVSSTPVLHDSARHMTASPGDKSMATESSEQEALEATPMRTETRAEGEEGAEEEQPAQKDQHHDLLDSTIEQQPPVTYKDDNHIKRALRKKKKSRDTQPPSPLDFDDLLMLPPSPPRVPTPIPEVVAPTKKSQGQKKREKEKLKKAQKAWDDEIKKEEEGFYNNSRARTRITYTYEHTNDSYWWFTDSANLRPSQPPTYHARRFIPQGTIFMWERPFMCIYNDPSNPNPTSFAAGIQTGNVRERYDRLGTRFPNAGDMGKVWTHSRILSNDSNESDNYWWGMFERLAAMRRSCKPSAKFMWDEKRTVGYLIACFDICRNDEITLPWLPGQEFRTYAERQKGLELCYYIDACYCDWCNQSLRTRHSSDQVRSRLSTFFNDQTLPLSAMQTPVRYYETLLRCLKDAIYEDAYTAMGTALEKGFWLCCHWSDAESAKAWARYRRDLDLYQWGERLSQWQKWSEYEKRVAQGEWEGLDGEWARFGDMTVGKPSTMIITAFFKRSEFEHFEEIYTQRREKALDGPPLPNIITPSKEDWDMARGKGVLEMDRFYDFKAAQQVGSGLVREKDGEPVDEENTDGTAEADTKEAAASISGSDLEGLEGRTMIWRLDR